MKQNSKQNEIVNAAKELFNMFGFEKTTMTDIANRLGISKASLYYYFADKESIIRSLAVNEQDQFISEIQKIIVDKTSTRDTLIAYSNKRIELLQKRITLSSSNLIAYSSVKSIFNTIIDEFRNQEIQLIKQILTIAQKNNEISCENIGIFAELYIDVLRGLRKNMFYNSNKIDLCNMNVNDIIQLQNQSRLFSNNFINGISL